MTFVMNTPQKQQTELSRMQQHKRELESGMFHAVFLVFLLNGKNYTLQLKLVKHLSGKIFQKKSKKQKNRLINAIFVKIVNH